MGDRQAGGLAGGYGNTLLAGRISNYSLADDGTVYAGVANGGVWRSQDSGRSWTDISRTLPTQIVGHVRAMQPWPGSFSTLIVPDHEPLRVSITAVEPTEEPADAAATPGTILPTEGELIVQSTGGPLRILRLKPAGKREMTGADFRRGHSLPAEARFGEV